METRWSLFPQDMAEMPKVDRLSIAFARSQDWPMHIATSATVSIFLSRAFDFHRLNLSTDIQPKSDL
jgi:hypothetical protein